MNRRELGFSAAAALLTASTARAAEINGPRRRAPKALGVTRAVGAKVANSSRN